MGETSNGRIDEEWLKSVTYEDLKDFIKSLRDRINQEECENDIFRRFLQRIEAKVGVSQQVIHESDLKTQNCARKRSKSPCSTVERTSKLSWEDKLQVAQFEHDEFKQEMEKAEVVMNKVIDDLRAGISELDIRHEDQKKHSADFEKSVVKEGYIDRTKCVASEKYIRFSEERMKQRETILEKIRLNTATLRSHLRKCKGQLRQKEEIGEVLHVVDFEQLKIENSQYLEKIEEKNRQIQSLKAVAARTLHVVNTLKMKIHELQREQRRQETEINQRQEICKRAKNEMIVVKEELKNEKKFKKRFQTHVDSFHVPSIMDFVQLKTEERQICRQETIHARKFKIAEMALIRHKKLWTQVRRSNLMGEV
ncbi:Coiled-coil domain-containing protein [Fasciola hepatica]|uniref:Cilia- and flagella-associated protein 263 n=1 Tax=Fasciola hepatica TaxID=6192 RepID=A0A4E0RWU7_FASHE|nr:Coiled-coil domain-containing protein [Fasciola hepatica]